MSSCSTHRAFPTLLWILAGCYAPPRGPTLAASRPNVDKTSPHCQMAVAALDAVVKTFDEQPLGLEKACVESLAHPGETIYVDARFTQGTDLVAVAEPTCTYGHYAIRFDWKTFTPSPSTEVVLLLAWNQSATDWRFNAVTEVSNWPKRRPEGMSLSRCGSAFGVLHRGAERWSGRVVPPPRSPDAL
jgi:hypothetical protein